MSLCVSGLMFERSNRVASHAYDDSSKDIIASDYARYTHSYHGCSQEVVRLALLSTVDLLWADPGVPQAA